MRSLGEVMVVVGLEGALLDQNGRMPRANAEVIRLFCSRGGRFTVASNRTPVYVQQVLRDIPVTEPVICCGGATIYDVNAKEYMAQRMLNTKAAAVMLDTILMAFPNMGVIIQRQDGTLCVARANAYTYEYMQRERAAYVVTQVCDIPEPWIRVILLDKSNQLDRLEQYAERHNTSDELSFSRASENAFHILGNHVSKGFALRELAEICEIQQSDIYSIGGEHGDQSLLQMTGHSVAMPSAPVRVKLAAELVTRLETAEGGTAEFLYQLIKEYEK